MVSLPRFLPPPGTCNSYLQTNFPADILNYALTLEHLEATFYEQGLKNYTHSDFMAAGCKDPVYANVKRIAEDEKSHEPFLTKALTAAGAKPVERCTYSFPSKDVKSFLAIGSMLEGMYFFHLDGRIDYLSRITNWTVCLQVLVLALTSEPLPKS